MLPKPTQETGKDTTNPLLNPTQDAASESGTTKLQDQTLTVKPATTPDSTNLLLIPSTNISNNASGNVGAPTFKANQITLNDPYETYGDAALTGTGIGVLTAAISAGAGTGAMWVAGALGTAGTVALPGVLTVGGLAAGAIIGGVVGGLVGLGVGLWRLAAAKSQQRASKHLQIASQALTIKTGNQFSAAQKNNLEQISDDGWKSLLHVSCWDVGDPADRQEIRNRVFEAAANHGPAAARELRKALVGTYISKKQVKDPALRAKLTDAAQMMAIVHGRSAGRQFRNELITLSKKDYDLSTVSAQQLCQLRMRSGVLRQAVGKRFNFASFVDSELGSMPFRTVRDWMIDNDVNHQALADPKREQGLVFGKQLLQHPGDGSFDQAYNQFVDKYIIDPYDRLNISHQIANKLRSAKNNDKMSVQQKKSLVQEAIRDYTRMIKARAGGFTDWAAHQRQTTDPFRGTKRLARGTSLQQSAALITPLPSATGKLGGVISGSPNAPALTSTQSRSTNVANDAWRRAKSAAQKLPTGSGVENAVATFIEQNTDALLQDAFWNAKVDKTGDDPKNTIENIAPSIAMHVLHRADESGTLTAKDIADFNKALNPTGRMLDPSKDYRLNPSLAGSEMNEELKNTMVTAIKNTYAYKEEQSNLFEVNIGDERPKIWLGGNKQNKLDATFNAQSSKADDKIGALEKVINDSRYEVAGQLAGIFQAAFDTQ